MNQIITLFPGQVFFSTDRNSNFNTLIYTVPPDRDQDDPFLMEKEVETDEFIYWTGGDDLGNPTQYFFKKP